MQLLVAAGCQYFTQMITEILDIWHLATCWWDQEKHSDRLYYRHQTPDCQGGMYSPHCALAGVEVRIYTTMLSTESPLLAMPLRATTVAERQPAIDRTPPAGVRDYVRLALALPVLAGLRWGHVRLCSAESAREPTSRAARQENEDADALQGIGC